MIISKSIPVGVDEAVKVGRVMCPYCGVGCLVDVKTQQNQVIELRGAVDASANKGLLCPKGALLGSILDLPGAFAQTTIPRPSPIQPTR